MEDYSNYSVRDFAIGMAMVKKQIEERINRIRADTSQLGKDRILYADFSRAMWKKLAERDCVSSHNMGFKGRFERLLCEIASGEKSS